MSDNTSDAVAANGTVYALLCYAISALFASTATALYIDSNPMFVWAIVGYVLALLSGWNADRSSWHPLRDIQSANI